MSKPKILIIDDEEAVRDTLENALRREGYELFFAENGKEGLSVFKKVSPILIILDLRMPVMDGFEFLEEIKIKPTDPFSVTVLTGHGDHEEIKKSYELGVNAFVRKPYDFVELRCMINRSIELKRLELQQRQLIQMDKMSTIGVMAAGVAHELNNPLSVTIGDIHLVTRDIRDILGYIDYFSKIPLPSDVSEDVEKYRKKIDLPYIMESIENKLSRCKDAAERAKDIVQGLKDFSHLDKGEVVAVDINKGIDDTLKIIPKGIRQDIKITKEFAPLPEIPCYGRQVNQVFLNIITNACYAIGGIGGELKIETSVDDIYVYIKFCDNGPGIPEDKIKQIFDPFFTTKKVGEGTGLGLSISYSIIEKHGGTITVTNNDDKGVTFTIKLLKEGDRRGKTEK